MRRVTAVLAASLFLGNFLIASNAARDFEIIDGTVVAESCIRGTYRTGKPEDNEHCPGYLTCEPGFFCDPHTHQRFLCPAGKYGDKPGLYSKECSGDCPAGHFCPIGSVNPQKCGGSNIYCPSGSSEPTAVRVGFYTVGGSADNTTRTSEVQCEPGWWCAGGVKRSCAGGTYAGTSNATGDSDQGSWGRSSPCDRQCPTGHYCPPGSIEPIPCSTPGDPRYYCPPGSTMRQPVQPRYYTVSSAHARTDTSQGIVDAQTAPSLLRSQQALCPVGHYCLGGVKHPCPAGRYGNKHGEVDPQCMGDCHIGYYCPPGSVSARQRRCGDATVYCPTGSTRPTAVDEGYYTVAGGYSDDDKRYDIPRPTQQKPDKMERLLDYRDADPTTRGAQVQCEAGRYCVGGIRTECSAGHYGDRKGQTTPTCSGLCANGFYCPRGSVVANQIPCGVRTYPDCGEAARAKEKSGFFAVDDRSGYHHMLVYCVINATTEYRQVVIDRQAIEASALKGSMLVDASGEIALRDVGQARVRMGRHADYYADTFDDVVALAQSGGWTVDGASTGLWDDPRVYCPEGSSKPLPVSHGHYTVSPVQWGGMSAEELCPLGHYCFGGIRVECPGGTFGRIRGLTDSKCSGQCRAGFYCPNASVVATMVRCGDATVYCPTGSTRPTAVDEGFHTIGLPQSQHLVPTEVSAQECRLECDRDEDCMGFSPSIAGG